MVTTQPEDAEQELWRALENLKKTGLRRSSPQDLAHMGRLYRTCAARLAQLQTRTPTRRVQRLNNLVARAHAVIYRPNRQPWRNHAARLFANEFPMMVAATWRYHLVAIALLLAGGVAGYLAVAADPENFFAIVPQSELRSPGASTEALIDSLRSGRDSSASGLSVFSSSLFTNNFRVGLLAFALGFLVGVPTVFLLVYNGVLLGAMTHVFVEAGLTVDWWAWILPHGITELSAIVICGGAGLLLGHAIAEPGQFSRLENVTQQAGRALRLALGTLPMFIIAALIEGFYRQSHATTEERFGLAIATLLLWVVYALWAVRSTQRRYGEPVDTDSRGAGLLRSAAR